MAFEIWAQADIVTVRLLLAPLNRAGNIERTILRAIGKGAATPNDLADIFGLAHRLVIDILADLWKAGWISVQMGTDTESLALTDDGRKELESAGEDGTAASFIRGTEELVLERLTGRVLPPTRSRSSPRDRSAVVPIGPEDRHPLSVSSAELAEALSDVLEQQNRSDAYQGRNLRVVEAHLEPEFLHVVSRRRYVPIRIDAHLSATGELTVAVVDAALSVRDRTTATTRLQRILDELPRSEFAVRVKSQATRAPLEDRGITKVVAELERTVAGMATCAPSLRQRAHDRAFDLTSQVLNYAQWLARQEMDLTLLSSLEDHRRSLTTLMESATRQIVLAVPWVTAAGLQYFRKPILGALERGVQVILLWGIEGGHQNLEQSVINWLDSMVAHINRAGLPGRLLFSRRRGARSHAKVAVADDRQMLVTSKNFLSTTDYTELGVLLAAPKIAENSDTEAAAPAIEAALAYLHYKMPEPILANSLNRIRGAFGPRVEPERAQLQLPAWREVLGENNALDAQVNAWALGWIDAVQVARTKLSSRRPSVEIVTDLQHRGILQGALQKAASRVLVTSHGLSDSALTGEIVELALARAEKGLQMSMRYWEVRGDGRSRIDELSRKDGSSPPSVDVQFNGMMHAKVVSHDDTVLLGSFNPLSVDAGLRNRRSTGEMGVKVDSAWFADSVWRALTGIDPIRTRDDVQVPQLMPAMPALAQNLLEAVEARSFDAIRTMVAQNGTTQVAEACSRFGLPREVLRSTGAVGLSESLAAGKVDVESGKILLNCMLEDGNWGAACLIRSFIPDSNMPPRLEFTSALAEGGPGGQAILAGLTSSDDLRPEEVQALRVVDLVAAVLGDIDSGSTDLSLDGEILRVLDPLVAEFDSVATLYWQSYGPLPRVLPVELQKVPLYGGEDLWESAEAAVLGLQHYPSNSASGTALQQYIFGTEGEMTQLLKALAGRDIGAVEAWRGEFVQNGNDDKWLDESARKAGLQKKIDASRRKSFLRHHRRISEATERLIAKGYTFQSREPRPAWSPDQLDLFRRIILVAESIRTKAEVAPNPESVVVSAEITRLLGWAEEGTSNTPVRSWKSWPFVTAYFCTTRHADNPSPVDLLKAVCEDIVKDRTAYEAVLEIAREGDFIQAQRTAELTERLELLEAASLDVLDRQIREYQVEAQVRVDEAVEELRLLCERADVDSNLVGVRSIQVEEKSDDAELALKAMRDAVASAIGVLSASLLERLNNMRADLAPDWAAYIESIIALGELRLAELALENHDGQQQLPRPTTFARWSWRTAEVQEMARWFDPAQPAPAGLRARFAPDPSDSAGQGVVKALQLLGSDDRNGAGLWVAALQRMVDEVDDGYRPEVVRDGDGLVAEFLMPSNNHLPRLRWMGGEPVRMSVGERRLPGTLLRLSLSNSKEGASGPVITVPDVLSLLRKSNGGEQPKASDRALQFLCLVCSRLPLEEVIAPRDTPAGRTEASRRRLAWLMAVLGMAPQPVDLDRIRLRAGGHPGVLWTLIDAARADDPIDGISALWARKDMDDLLVRGIARDLDREEDLLVLGLGLSNDYFGVGCTTAELWMAVGDLWAERGGRLPSERVRVSEAVERLKESGYVVETEGELHVCDCSALRALARTATPAWLSSLVDRVDATDSVEARAFETILTMIRHQQQAANAVLSEASNREEAWKRTRMYLAEDSPFELGRLCQEVVSDFRGRQKTADIILSDQDDLTRQNEELWVNAAGPRIWLYCLLHELITNALAATAGLREGEGTIKLEINPSAERDSVSLTVSNDGQPMPIEVVERFNNGGWHRDAARPDRGTGLHTYRVFGKKHNVNMAVKVEGNLTSVTCTMPLGATGPSNP